MVLVTIALDGTDSATSSFFKSSTVLTWQTMNRSYTLTFAGPSAAPLLPCLTARRPRPLATADRGAVRRRALRVVFVVCGGLAVTTHVAE